MLLTWKICFPLLHWLLTLTWWRGYSRWGWVGLWRLRRDKRGNVGGGHGEFHALHKLFHSNELVLADLDHCGCCSIVFVRIFLLRLLLLSLIAKKVSLIASGYSCVESMIGTGSQSRQFVKINKLYKHQFRLLLYRTIGFDKEVKFYRTQIKTNNFDRLLVGP